MKPISLAKSVTALLAASSLIATPVAAAPVGLSVVPVVNGHFGELSVLPTDKTGPHYHRVKYEIPVSGTEQALYAWLDRMQTPGEFRAVTFLRLSPNREDDTKIDATVIVEQWYVPAA